MAKGYCWPEKSQREILSKPRPIEEEGGGGTEVGYFSEKKEIPQMYALLY